jgi:hypothetical protein
MCVWVEPNKTRDSIAILQTLWDASNGLLKSTSQTGFATYNANNWFVRHKGQKDIKKPVSPAGLEDTRLPSETAINSPTIDAPLNYNASKEITSEIV